MAKIIHNNFIDMVDEMLATAKNEGTIHLYPEDKILSGRSVQINGKGLFHFATTIYLVLVYGSQTESCCNFRRLQKKACKLNIYKLFIFRLTI